MSDSPIYPHDPIEEIGLDVFLVRGSIKMNALRIVQTAAFLVQGGLSAALYPSGEWEQGRSRRRGSCKQRSFQSRGGLCAALNPSGGGSRSGRGG